MSESLYQQLRTLAGVPKSEWEFAAPQIRALSLARHEVLLAAGSVCRQLAFVETGVLRSFLTTDEREITNDFFLPGTFAAAYTSFITQAPSAWTLQALAPCQVLLFSHDLLHLLYARHRCWLELGKALLEAQFVWKCRRETSFLRETAAQRYQLLQQHYPTLEQHVPQYYLASYLGIQPATLSRLRARVSQEVPALS